MRFTIPFALRLATAAFAAPMQASTGVERRCFPSCSATNPTPSLPTIGLSVQVAVWAQVDVPAVIINLQNMVATGSGASTSAVACLTL